MRKVVLLSLRSEVGMLRKVVLLSLRSVGELEESGREESPALSPVCVVNVDISVSFSQF